MTKTPRQDDIEIYIVNTSPEAIREWLQSCFDTVNLTISKQSQAMKGELSLRGQSILFTLYPKAQGKNITGLWFQSSHTPWPTDLDCAKAASKSLDTEVRCSKNNWKEGEEAETLWWSIKGDQEKLITW